jgi:hypothetical protein
MLPQEKYVQEDVKFWKSKQVKHPFFLQEVKSTHTYEMKHFEEKRRKNPSKTLFIYNHLNEFRASTG